MQSLILPLKTCRLPPLQVVEMWLTSVCATAASSSSSSSCTRRSSWTAALESLSCPLFPKSVSTSVFPFVCSQGVTSLSALEDYKVQGKQIKLCAPQQQDVAVHGASSGCMIGRSQGIQDNHCSSGAEHGSVAAVSAALPASAADHFTSWSATVPLCRR